MGQSLPKATRQVSGRIISTGLSARSPDKPVTSHQIVLFRGSERVSFCTKLLIVPSSRWYLC